ncbi:MAG: MATE family efflux transporter [Thermoanaerobaculia bacterium]
MTKPPSAQDYQARPLLNTELRAVVRLAVPVVLTHLGMMLMGVVDVMMLGRFSEQALAAGALGNSVSIALLMLPMGILMALDPLVAQAFGAGDHPRVARCLRQGLVMAVLLSIPLSAAMWPLEGPLTFLGQQPEIVRSSASYLRALVPGNVAYLLFIAVRHSLQAMSVVRPAVIAMVVANLINVVANYALIFGNFGFPALGVVGSAAATSLSRWTLLLILIAASWPALSRYLKPSLFGRGDASVAREKVPVVETRILRRMLHLGFPIGMQLSIEIWFFVTVALLMGNLGTRELAAHQVALSLAAFSFMVPLGISGAAATRVGNAIGCGGLPEARRSAVVCLGLGAAVMTVSAAAFWLFPRYLARLFTDEAGVIEVAVVLIPIAALFQIFDGLQVVAFGALRGAGDTRFPAALALIGFWLLGLPLGLLLAYRADLGPRGLWWGFTIGLGAVAVLLIWRLLVRFSRPLSVLEDDP